MELKLLSWFSTFLNFLILVYISFAIVGAKSFSMLQMSFSFFGLFASILVNVVSTLGGGNV